MSRNRVVPILVCAALLPWAALPGHADEASTAFSYEAPRDLTGPVAMRLLLDFGPEQPCSFRVQVAGTTRRPPILMWEESDGRTGAFFSSYTAQAHTTVAGQTADTRTLVAPGGAWSFDGTAETTFSGVLDYRLVLPAAGSWENARTGYHPAVRIDIGCAGPLAVLATEVGREAAVFKADSLQGGTGASVYQPLGGSVNSNDGDGLAADFTSDVVRLRVTDTTTSSDVQGVLSLSHPAGATSWPLDGDDDITLEDGPGAYRLELDRRAVGFSDRLLGVLYGLTPVESLAGALGAADG